MDYVVSIAVLIGIYVILASSFNLIIGYGGLISIAHPIFFALGAYTTGLIGIHLDLNPILSVLFGGAVALLASLMLSIPSLRISGDYLLITSIGFQLGLLEVIKNVDFVGGASGLGNVPNHVSGPYRNLIFAAISCVTAIAVVLFIRWMVNGPYGRAIAAMRDDEVAFSALGRNAMNIKITIFAIGSGLAGIAGGIYVHFYQYVSPEQFEILQSATILTMVVVGGMGSTIGPVVGAVLLLALPQAITFLNLPTSIMAPLQGLIFTRLVLRFCSFVPTGSSHRAGGRVEGRGYGRRDWRRDWRRDCRHCRRDGRPFRTGPCPRQCLKRFGGIVVADHITLDIRRGEILGLIGPNGAGKTSLFNLISGVVPADAGRITVNGNDLDGLALHQRARLGVARTWQHIRLFNTMTVLDNLQVGPRSYPGESLLSMIVAGARVRRFEAASRDKAMSILERMKLEHLAQAIVVDIPYGQQKLVGVARALMNDGDCLLLDEPMAGVEGQAYETMKAVVRQEAAAGRAVCVVEHNVSFVRDLCNSAVFMVTGQILERGSVEELLRSKTLAQLYFGA